MISSLVLSILATSGPNLRAQGDPSLLTKTFGKASYAVLAEVLDMAVWDRRGKRLETLPKKLRQGDVMQIAIRPISWLTGPHELGVLTVQLKAEGTAPGPCFAWLLDKRIFLLKKNLNQLKGDFLYPADYALISVPQSYQGDVDKLIERRNSGTLESEDGENHVKGKLPHVRMEEGNDCWAAALAMMLSWRDQTEYTRAQAAKMAGPQFVSILEADTGIEGTEKDVLLRSFGLHGEKPQTFTARGLEELLAENGPLWVTISLNDPRKRNALPHARIIFSIKKGTSPETTILSFYDPNRAGVVKESLTDFTASFEAVANLDRMINPDSDQPFRTQIIHF